MRTLAYAYVASLALMSYATSRRGGWLFRSARARDQVTSVVGGALVLSGLVLAVLVIFA